MDNQQQARPTVRAARIRKCPLCGHESWRLAYGEIMPNEQALMPPNTVFAGCCLDMVQRTNAVTGEPEMGIARWQCQNPECRHLWW
ncbi:hypothetical protein IV500_03885 [Paeniglutamicibacter antarcticus]|uniref:Uncharacterized protein n=1 Tax=Arthrobacter terrae TaxID=2935737 RepID=A0A931CHA3_9MICC|nr:hypothetical protein [Arthrobacter terrae]MBG0738562.1 hypothetical protein [Arthrobacter terrae]